MLPPFFHSLQAGKEGRHTDKWLQIAKCDNVRDKQETDIENKADNNQP